MANTFPLPPHGTRVPPQGAKCSTCLYVGELDPNTCLNLHYIQLSYKGKVKGDVRFIDGVTGEVVDDPNEFCCNAYDWER